MAKTFAETRRNPFVEQGRNEGLEEAAALVEQILQNNDATVIARIPVLIRELKR